MNGTTAAPPLSRQAEPEPRPVLGWTARSCILLLLFSHGFSFAEAPPAKRPGPDLEDFQTYDGPPVTSELFTSRLIFTNHRGSETTFYGQFNPAYQVFDDGVDTTRGLVDNGYWNSRLGFLVNVPAEENTLRLRFETALGLRSSAGVSQDFTPDTINWQRTALRWFEAALDTRYGTVSAGQGSMATDGTSGVDDSFTMHAGAADSTDGFAAFRFRDGNGGLTDVTVGSVNDTFDGARRFRLRYDSPRFAGTMLSTSYGRNVLVSGNNTIDYDVALRRNRTLGDVAIRSAIGYAREDNPDGENREQVAGSVSAFHNPTGLNLAFSAGSIASGPDFIYTRLGWRAQVSEIGVTSVSADFYQGRDFLSDGARTENYGLYAVQSIDKLSADAYAGWRRFTYRDELGGSYKDADSLILGLRYFF
jgi:hypothetical protein